MDLIFVDANILFSRTLRDWTLMLGEECNRFAVISSRDCLVEAIANIRERNLEVEGGVISHIHDLIQDSLHDVVGQYPGGPIAGMEDKKDWHVVHAATAAGAKILVTLNIKDFAPVADSLSFDLYTPDELFDLIWKNDPQAVEAVATKQVKYWQGVAKRYESEGRPAPKGMVQALQDAGAPEFATIIGRTLRKLSGEIDGIPTAVTAASEVEPQPAASVDAPSAH